MWIFFDSGGQSVGSSGFAPKGAGLIPMPHDASLANVAGDAGVDSAILLGFEISNRALAEQYEPLASSGGLAATIENGEVVKIYPAPEAPTFYLKVLLSAQDGSAMPTTLGSSGPEPKASPGGIIRVDASLHVADDDSSALAPTGPAAIEFPIQVMNESGGDSQAVPVAVTNGAAAFHYTVPSATGKFILDESRLGPVALGGVPITFKLMSACPVIFWVLDDSAITPIVE